MNASELVNEPLAVQIAGAQVFVRRLGKLQILAAAEDYVIERQLALTARGESAQGEDVRKQALGLILGDPPTQLVLRWLGSAIVKPTMNQQELFDLTEKGTPEEVGALMRHALSLGDKSVGVNGNA